MKFRDMLNEDRIPGATRLYKFKMTKFRIKFADLFAILNTYGLSLTNGAYSPGYGEIFTFTMWLRNDEVDNIIDDLKKLNIALISTLIS